MVERDLAKIEVTGSIPVVRSKRRAPFDPDLVRREAMRTGRNRMPGTTADSSIRTAGGFRCEEPAEGFSPVGTMPTWLIGRAADCLSAS